jgi:diaminopimelate decarboxylase
VNTVERDPKTKQIFIESVSLAALAKKYGTPLYVYSHARLVDNFRRVRDAFAPLGEAMVAFSMKTNANGAILRLLVGEGAGLDIVSGGELERALMAGADPAKIVFAGVGKTEPEIAAALRAAILAFNVESEAEAESIAAVARQLRLHAPICLRVNPDVDAGTHAYISTGKKENKFGIPIGDARRLMKKLATLPQLDLIGVHCHIGSQILDPSVYVEAIGRMAELIRLLRGDGHRLRVLNMGGGFGIAYTDEQEPMDVAGLAKRLAPTIESLGVKLILEPGRFIAGPAGFLLTRVIYVKPGAAKNFAIVDGAMNDLIRPSLYSAFHRILLDGPERRGKRLAYDVVGPICESGDFLGKDRVFPPLAAGDLLLACDAGAYGMAMASNYNSRPRPAEVMVKGSRSHLIRWRETVARLVADEIVPNFLEEKPRAQRKTASSAGRRSRAQW